MIRFFSGIRIRLLILILAGAGISSCEDLQTDLNGSDPRDRLVDTWKVEESGNPLKTGNDVYWVEISKHLSDSSKILIYNFYNVDADAEAILSNNVLDLPLQHLEGGFTVNGRGEIQGTRANQIIWTYSVDDGSGVAENVTAVYSRLTF
jgi:hypothetical protein